MAVDSGEQKEDDRADYQCRGIYQSGPVHGDKCLGGVDGSWGFFGSVAAKCFLGEGGGDSG